MLLSGTVVQGVVEHVPIYLFWKLLLGFILDVAEASCGIDGLVKQKLAFTGMISVVFITVLLLGTYCKSQLE